METLPSLGLTSLDRMYALIDELKSEEVRAARGIKIARTKMHMKLKELAGLCTVVDKEVSSATDKRLHGKTS